MSVNQQTFNQYLDKLLEPSLISDYCPNGLQVGEKNKEIKTLVSGVTASEKLIDQAIAKNADAILVHHGLFFKGELQTITNWKYKRIEKLIKHNISLFAYHLPLDVHPIYGNNIQLANKLSLNVIGSFETGSKPDLGIITEAASPLSLEDISSNIDKVLNRKPLVIESEYGAKAIKTIGICTGGAQDFISYASNANLDLYISGEISERTTHLACELGIHYIAAGHHATERYGAMALGEHLKEHFNLIHHFIDIDNPV